MRVGVDRAYAVGGSSERDQVHEHADGPEQGLRGRVLRGAERIFGLNPEVMEERSLAHAHVDLCAIDRKNHRCHFVETKIHKAATGQHEGYARHQLLFLASVGHAAKALGARAFVGEPYEVVPELIVFVGPKEEYPPESQSVSLVV